MGKQTRRLDAGRKVGLYSSWMDNLIAVDGYTDGGFEKCENRKRF